MGCSSNKINRTCDWSVESVDTVCGDWCDWLLNIPSRFEDTIKTDEEKCNRHEMYFY